MSSKAVIVVDIQNDYFEGGAFPLYRQKEAAANAALVIAKAREDKVPVIFIQHLSESMFFIKDTPGAEINEMVKPLEGEKIIQKWFPNSFRGTSLAADLEALGGPKAVELTIVGSMSQMCIEATTRAAADMEYKCIVVEDACAAPAQAFNGVEVSPQQTHAVAMSALSFGYAKIVTTEEYLKA